MDTAQTLPVCAYDTLSPEKTLQFPYHIPNTDLWVDEMIAYDGLSVDAASGQELFTAVAVLIHNSGNKGVESAEIVITQKDRQLCFAAESIPPGGMVLVTERSCNEYIQGIYTNCWVKKYIKADNWWAEDAPYIVPVSMHALEITNPYDYPLEQVWLHYKNYYADRQMYVGGITYKVGIRKLFPGQTVRIEPPNYAYGFSRIARVTVG